MAATAAQKYTPSRPVAVLVSQNFRFDFQADFFGRLRTPLHPPPLERVVAETRAQVCGSCDGALWHSRSVWGLLLLPLRARDRNV